MTINALGVNTQTYSASAIKPQVEKQEKDENTSWFSDWLNDKDKVCTDGKDDGSLSVGEAVESFGKGLISIAKVAVNHPVKTALSAIAGIGLTALTGGAILPVFVAGGALLGAGMIGKGAYDAINAETDAEAKQAWESMGTGTFAFGTSALTAKSALQQANAAGVKNAITTDNPIKNLLNCFKSTPRALKVSAWQIDSKFRTLYLRTNMGRKDFGSTKLERWVEEFDDSYFDHPRYEAQAEEMIQGMKNSLKEGAYARPVHNFNGENYYKISYGCDATASQIKGYGGTMDTWTEYANSDFSAYSKMLLKNDMKSLAQYGMISDDDLVTTVCEQRLAADAYKQKAVANEITNLAKEAGIDEQPYLNTLQETIDRGAFRLKMDNALETKYGVTNPKYSKLMRITMDNKDVRSIVESSWDAQNKRYFTLEWLEETVYKALESTGNTEWL